MYLKLYSPPGRLLDGPLGQKHALAAALRVLAKSTLTTPEPNFINFGRLLDPPGGPKSVLKKYQIEPRADRSHLDCNRDALHFRSDFRRPLEFRFLHFKI